MHDWQKCCLAYQGDTEPCATSCLHCARMATVVVAERDRCAAIVQAARFDEVDRDWRAIVSMIEGGRSAEELIAEAKV